MKQPTIVVTSGLPGSGKSTIAEGIGRLLRAPVFSIDPAEAAMWVSGLPKESTGIAAYRVVEAIATENLKLGLTVIVDAVNPVEQARQMWRDLGDRFQVPVCFIECFCGDDQIHRTRIEKRVRNIAGMPEMTWERVLERKAEYEDWRDTRLKLDTATEAPEVLIARAMDYVQSI
jgi:predicted kinase